MKASVIGFGQPNVGDDGVGIAVLKELRSRLDDSVKLQESQDATILIDALRENTHVVIVDAVIDGAQPGSVKILTEDQIVDGCLSPLSTHIVGVPQAIALARALAEKEIAHLTIVGISIETPKKIGHHLSLAVKNAIPRAVETVRTLLAAYR